MPSKKQKPQSLQEWLWQLGYARLSFEHVRNACDYILQTPISVDSPIYYPLVAAIYTLYARPFSYSKPIGKWTTQAIPKEHLDLHNQMMRMRNELIAHSDATTSILVSDMPGNNVRIVRSSDRFEIGNFQAKPDLSFIARIRDLAVALILRIDTKLESLWTERNREFPDLIGEYLVDPVLNRFTRVPASDLFPP